MIIVYNETVWTLLRALTMNLIAKLGEERKYSHAGIQIQWAFRIT